MRRFHVVGGGGSETVPPPPCHIADDIRAAAERAIAEGAVTIFLRWETPRDYNMATIPNAPCVTAGHAYAMEMWLHEAYGAEVEE